MARRIPCPGSLQGEQAIEVVRIRYRGGDGYDDHCHAFAEVFWIEEGRARHRRNDHEEILAAGDLVLIRPQDVHSFATVDQAGFTMVNVVFRADLLETLRQRHGSGLWPWDEAAPRRQLDAQQVDRLQAWAEDLATDTSLLAAEGFLIDLLRRCLLTPSRPIQGVLPAWLDHAFERFASGEGLSEGTKAFRRFTGRSCEQVNRVIRAHFGRTATEVINDLRLEHAARRLRMGEGRIVDIAEACGYASLPHFYRSFQARYAMTPRAFRRSLQAPGRGLLRAQAVKTTRPLGRT